jgi:two-component system LytT family sensor kinase
VLYLLRVKSFSQSLLKAAGSRLAVNIYFWLVFLLMRADYAYTPLKATLTIVLYALLAMLFYTNNLLLVPRLLAKRKYQSYLGLYTLLVFVVASLYTGVLKWTMHYHPDITTGMISSLQVGTESAEWSFGSLMREMPLYFVALAISGAVFSMSWFVMNYQRLQKTMADTQKEHLQAELSFLKSQINPHFLFNTLNNLYALTAKKSDEAPETVAQLSAILRYFLYESNTPLVSSDKELEMMRAYIDLELLRISRKDQLRFSIETDRSYTIPPLLWVPLLENVFKHGTRFIADAYNISFRFTIKNGVLHISSRNTFKATELRDDAAATGIGLANLRKRLELLYPGRHTLEAQTEGPLFMTSLQIQLA